ncbi:hypothetical protein NY08_453 [Rhodococcus sp. B7740]|nr:hypothetical protein NY08_453 [Rhodococcus sp. B7740]
MPRPHGGLVGHRGHWRNIFVCRHGVIIDRSTACVHCWSSVGVA